MLTNKSEADILSFKIYERSVDRKMNLTAHNHVLRISAIAPPPPRTVL
ncbi:MAG: hypothetical protein LBK73_07475 [Treponema sp.]|nr:hypothetical protein [Treponema sp.]